MKYEKNREALSYFISHTSYLRKAMNTDQSLEVEVKFWTADFTPIKAVLADIGATCTKPRYYERNAVYDTPAGTYRKKHEVVRLRQDQRIRLTFKRPAPTAVQAQTEAKVREEIELEVSDYGRMEQILAKLGLTEQRLYEKYRETWVYGAVEIVLDEMPFGYFIELEGAENDLKACVAQLQLNWESRILASYWDLMEDVRDRYPFTFDDMTFANFAKLEMDTNTIWGGS